MGTKLKLGKFDCYDKALPDEPMFVLLARDPDFYRLVSEWATTRWYDILSGERPESDIDLVNEARSVAAAAAKWRKENMGKWRQPPNFVKGVG